NSEENMMNGSTPERKSGQEHDTLPHMSRSGYTSSLPRSTTDESANSSTGY
ncbi:hypothetical protein L9F63_023761, partial [Diploptera punctata]